MLDCHQRKKDVKLIFFYAYRSIEFESRYMQWEQRSMTTQSPQIYTRKALYGGENENMNKAHITYQYKTL